MRFRDLACFACRLRFFERLIFYFFHFLGDAFPGERTSGINGPPCDFNWLPGWLNLFFRHQTGLLHHPVAEDAAHQIQGLDNPVIG